jgi:glycosyltransferase involved in cell wall biosynthesis
LTGWVSELEAKKLLAKADMLVLPSYAEGMSMAVLEAMAWGLAVITTAAGGSADFLVNGRNCLVVSPGDVPAICAAICNVVESPDLRSALGREARRTAESFNADGYVEKLVSIYREVAALP